MSYNCEFAHVLRKYMDLSLSRRIGRWASFELGPWSCHSSLCPANCLAGLTPTGWSMGQKIAAARFHSTSTNFLRYSDRSTPTTTTSSCHPSRSLKNVLFTLANEIIYGACAAIRFLIISFTKQFFSSNVSKAIRVIFFLQHSVAAACQVNWK